MTPRLAFLQELSLGQLQFYFLKFQFELVFIQRTCQLRSLELLCLSLIFHTGNRRFCLFFVLQPLSTAVARTHHTDLSKTNNVLHRVSLIPVTPKRMFSFSSSWGLNATGRAGQATHFTNVSTWNPQTVWLSPASTAYCSPLLHSSHVSSCHCPPQTPFSLMSLPGNMMLSLPGSQEQQQ